MSEKQRELYHDGALCPECGERVGVPNIPEGDDPCSVPMGYDFERDAHECGLLMCASCGHEWAENHVGEIARAWCAHGAYEQHQVEERRNLAITKLLASIEAKTVTKIAEWLRERAKAAESDAWSYRASARQDEEESSWNDSVAYNEIAAAIGAGKWKEKTDDER